MTQPENEADLVPNRDLLIEKYLKSSFRTRLKLTRSLFLTGNFFKTKVIDFPFWFLTYICV